MDFEFTKYQKKYFELYKNGESFIWEGKRRVGKTTLLRKIIEDVSKSGKTAHVYARDRDMLMNLTDCSKIIKGHTHLDASKVRGCLTDWVIVDDAHRVKGMGKHLLYIYANSRFCIVGDMGVKEMFSLQS